MEAETRSTFQTLSENVGRFDLRGKTFLIPEMNRIGSHLLAAVFRGFGIHALVMETYKGLALGKEFTSGKECFPCQVTTGDILLFMEKEKKKRGEDFNPADYVYFMPEAGGPCRFGMYNKYQRIVLDSFPDLKKIKIGSLTTDNSYALDGMIEAGRSTRFRKAAFLSQIVGDVLDRLLWRIRPYEKEAGSTDAFIKEAMDILSEAFEKHGAAMNFEGILRELDEIILRGKVLIDPGIPPKPLIGIVGEIYLRTHVHANQDVIRMIEKYGGEVVNASIAEWVNYTTYDKLRDAKIGLNLNLKEFRIGKVRQFLGEILKYGINLHYQQSRQEKIYERVRKFIDVPDDHRIGHLENILLEDDIYSFDVGTEACLSIPGIIQYMRENYNGVVNVYPFTCMPSTVTSSIVKPLMTRMKVPYLDTPYDGATQPGREAAIRTFMYQASQHFNRNGRKEQRNL